MVWTGTSSLFFTRFENRQQRKFTLKRCVFMNTSIRMTNNFVISTILSQCSFSLVSPWIIKAKNEWEYFMRLCDWLFMQKCTTRQSNIFHFVVVRNSYVGNMSKGSIWQVCFDRISWYLNAFPSLIWYNNLDYFVYYERQKNEWRADLSVACRIRIQMNVLIVLWSKICNLDGGCAVGSWGATVFTITVDDYEDESGQLSLCSKLESLPT